MGAMTVDRQEAAFRRCSEMPEAALAGEGDCLSKQVRLRHWVIDVN